MTIVQGCREGPASGDALSHLSWQHEAGRREVTWPYRCVPHILRNTSGLHIE